MKNTDGKIIYLIEDKEGFYLSEEIDPPLKPTLKPGKDLFTDFFSRTGRQRIIEYGSSKIADKEGEVYDYKYSRKFFFKYHQNGYAYDYEVPVNDRNEMITDERLYYKSGKITKKEVLEYFKENKEIRQELDGLNTLFFSTAVSGLGLFLCLMMLIFSFMGKSPVISSRSVPLTEVSDTGTVFITNTWNIPKKDELYLMELKFDFGTSASSLQEISVGVDIFEEKTGIVNTIEGDFYYETGWDSDGHWTESQTKASQYLRSDETGKFYAAIYPEAIGTDTNGVLTFSLKKAGFLWYYTLTSTIFMLILTGILYFILYERSN